MSTAKKLRKLLGFAVGDAEVLNATYSEVMKLRGNVADGIASLRALLGERPSICTVLLLAQAIDGPFYACETFVLLPGGYRIVTFRPQQNLRGGAWLVAFGGALLSSARVGDKTNEFGHGQSPIVQLRDPAAISVDISVRASLDVTELLTR